MNEEKYGYDDVEETEVLEVFDPNSIIPVTPPVATAPEVQTEPETEVLTEAPVEEVTEPVIEASLFLGSRPGALNECLPQIFVPVRNSPRLYFSCTLFVSLFKSAP